MKLRVEHVSFAYPGRPVLEDLDLDVEEGELLGLVGPNGAGKSTLLRVMHAALAPARGRVLVDGRDLGGLSRREIARLLGVVPQSSSPAFPVSVAQFVGMGRYAREPFLGGPSPEDGRVVRECLSEMGVEALADRPVDEISGGEFRRVLIAQALAQEPTVLLFDEPVQQLDLLHQIEVMGFAREFTRRGGTAGVIVLHDLGLAARYCDRIALLCRGRVLAIGAPGEVLTVEHLREAYRVNAHVSRCEATDAVRVVALSPSEEE